MQTEMDQRILHHIGNFHQSGELSNALGEAHQADMVRQIETAMGQFKKQIPEKVLRFVEQNIQRLVQTHIEGVFAQFFIQNQVCHLTEKFEVLVHGLTEKFENQWGNWCWND